MTTAYPNRTRFLWKRSRLQRVRNLDLWTWIRHPHSVRFLRSSRVLSRAPQNSAPEPLWKLIKNMTITNNGRWTVAALRGPRVDGTEKCARTVKYVNFIINKIWFTSSPLTKSPSARPLWVGCRALSAPRSWNRTLVWRRRRCANVGATPHQLLTGTYRGYTGWWSDIDNSWFLVPTDYSGEATTK